MMDEFFTGKAFWARTHLRIPPSPFTAAMSTLLLRRCYECGQPLGRKDVFCPRCGAKQPRDPKQQSMDRINKIYKIQTEGSLRFFALILLIA